MDSLNFAAVGKALLDLIKTSYVEEDVQLNETHYVIAEYLLDCLENLDIDCVFVDENENFEGICVLITVNTVNYSVQIL